MEAIALRVETSHRPWVGGQPSPLGWRPAIALRLEAIHRYQGAGHPSLIGWRPTLLGWRPSLIGWRSSLIGWRPWPRRFCGTWRLHPCKKTCVEFVAGTALCEPRCADCVAGAVLCEPPRADFVAGTALCEPPCFSGTTVPRRSQVMVGSWLGHARRFRGRHRLCL